MYPKIKFQIHQELDIQIGSKWPDAKIQYKELNSINTQNFVQNYYKRNEKELNNAVNKMALDWGSVEKEFYEASDAVFKNYPWPDGLYVCYISIFNCNPRYLENKTFQVFYKNSVGVKTIAAHELLHFIFYDYVEKIENDFYRKVGKDEIWRLSESFDVLALENSFFKTFAPKIPGGYTEILELNDKLRQKLKEKDFTISNFVKVAKLLN